MSTNNETSVPTDFPRDFSAPTLPGTQPNLTARKIDGLFVVGQTEGELFESWVYCEDMALQLAERMVRKQAAGLVCDVDVFYRETEHRVRGQGWDLSNDEVIWLMKRTRALAGHSTPSSPEG